MELFEQIRRDKDREDLSERALAARYRVGRGTVRQALESPVPPSRRRPQGRSAPKLGQYRQLIDGWLREDLDAPRKQRHTARRIWKRLVDEHGADVAEATVREHVRNRRRELGLTVGQVFVPQIHTPAQTAEVDWGEAQVHLAGSRVKVHVFVMRSCFSGAAFSMASPVETQQAFLEGHALAFAWFAGVFEEVRYDNLGSAVKKVLRGPRRVETDRFVAMRSHYLFESIFTTPGIEGAHENVIFVGDSGTGKTMLATALGVCACQQGRRVKFITLAALANELQEAVSRDELSRVVARYARIDVLLLDELGYLRLPDGAAELVFQVLSERHE